jgi:bifunctional DNA-binding transcriptional regulator/antitoxin component of YhaV-PrlF toxin-antitoxin module
MTSKTAFSNGGSAAARLPSEAGIKPGDAIVVTVVAPGKVVVERAAEVPDYSVVIRKRSRKGGNVTAEMVARLLEQSGL